MARRAFAGTEIIANYNAKKSKKLQNGRGRNVCSIVGRLCSGKCNASTKYLTLLKIIESIYH